MTHGRARLGALLLGCTLAMPVQAAASSTDPLEAINRPIFQFNDALDRHLLRPVASSYAQWVNPGIRQLVGNVFSNFNDPWVGLNNLLQGKPVEALSDFTRFAINTVFCFGGLGDLAGELGLRKHNEDLGQTLGSWGVPAGPYLVLPLLGPSSLRDALGTAGAMRVDALRQVDSEGDRLSLAVLRVVDTRAGLLPLDRLIEGAALDRYLFVRNAYLQRRQNLVHDGNPPEPPEPTDSKE
jgi:phospholipid-binding lipoprotein MlaA